MKNLIASIFVGLLSGVTVYLLIDNLFERPSKTVKPTEVEDFEEFEEVDDDESPDNTIPLKKAAPITDAEIRSAIKK